ncbi:winged helix DNA-binding protein [Streptomyces zaomyceticus]|uniref:winged helix DNA-binding protein n=1 Tax=Streptomyces zaomyceticus TaxID=68286 RepID=UPI00324B2120
MEQPVVNGVARDPSGATFAIVGIANTPTDWAKVFRSLANTDLTFDPAAGADQAVLRAVAEATGSAATREAPAAAVTGARSMSMTPPSVLNLNAYLMYALGKVARRRLTDKLEARGLRLWHLTVMTLLADLGPQMKTALASRLDMNASDLVKIVNDLARIGQVDCVRDATDRRRVVVRLTPEGRTYLADLSAEIASTDDEILAPLDAGEREQLASLLRRVHSHLEPAPAGVVHERRGGGARITRPEPELPVHADSFEDGRIDWTRPAEEIARLVAARRPRRPHAYTHHGGRRIEILAATVTRRPYAGTPGLVLHSEDEGVVIVTGTDAHTGANHGLVPTLVRTEEGREIPARDHFRAAGVLVDLD